MSIKIMSWVWESGPQSQSDRFVLLALADYANDEGECWPSIAGIRAKVCMSERGVQTVIRRLEATGWLSIEVGKGRKNCNVYMIKTPQVDLRATAVSRRSVDRFAIFARDAYTCVYCGYQGVSVGQEIGSDLHVDHVIPVSRGGTDVAENLVCSCGPCNVSKANKTPSEWAKNPAASAPRIICTPQVNAKTPQITALNPAASAPEPSVTIKEPPVSKRGSRLAQDWFLPTAWGEWALGEGFSEAAIRDQAERFRDYWHAAPAARGVKADWLATWRTWMRNARDRQPQLKAITGGRNDRAQFAVAHREYTRRIAAGEVNRGPDPSDPFGGR